MRNRHRDGAAACAEIQDPWLDDAVASFQCEFDQQFGFRTRNQYLRRDAEIQAVEFTCAHQLCNRFTGQAAVDQLPITLDGLLRQYRIGACNQRGARPFEHMGQQDTGFERIERAGLDERIGWIGRIGIAGAQQLGGGGHGKRFA